MRVLIDYRSALRHRSGTGEYIHRLASALAARSAQPGARLHITLFSSSWKDRLPSSMIPGIASVDRRVPVRVLNFAWHRLEWPPAEWLAGGSYDVVHSNHPLLMPARRAAQVVMVHDLYFLAHPEHTDAEVRRDYPALAGHHARRADHIIVPSQFTASEVERMLHVPRERISVCPPGAPDWKPRLHQPAGGYLLHFGTLEPRKNIGTLLDAYEQLLAADGAERGMMPELVLAGRATPAAGPWLDRLKRPPLSGRVRHIGYVDDADRRRVFEGARALVHPSFEEGFGISVLEAMTLGVPVISAQRGSLPEVVGEAGLLVNPDDPASIAAGVRRVLEDASFASACASAASERAQRFQWSSTADRMIEAYRLAVAHRAARPNGSGG